MIKLVPLFFAFLTIGAVQPAAAPSDGTNVIATSGAWYTSSTTAPVGTATIASGDFPVGRGPQGEDKRSYLAFELPEGARTAKIALRISQGPATNIGAPGTVHACPATQRWLPGSGLDLATAPTADCAQPVAGTSAGGKLQFDLTPIVQRWSLGQPNYGVGFVAHTDQPLPWQVTFSVSLDEVVGSATAGSGPGADAGADPMPFDAPSAETPSFALAPLPVIAPLPAADYPAEVALEPSAARTPVRATGPLDALPVNLAIWLLLPAGAGVLFVCARSLGPSGEPRSALDRVLPSRRGAA